MVHFHTFGLTMDLGATKKQRRKWALARIETKLSSYKQVLLSLASKEISYMNHYGYPIHALLSLLLATLSMCCKIARVDLQEIPFVWIIGTKIKSR